MKKQIYYLIILTAIALNACTDKISEIFIANSPIYMSYEELRSSIKQVESQELIKPGKMYFKDDYIFIVEQMKGIHVIDNSNPSSPQNISFIEIPGTVDIAIKGQILYTDSYIDLVALDLSDLNNITEASRSKDVLSYILPPYDEDYPIAKLDEDKGVVIGWEIKKVKQSPESYYYPKFRTMDMVGLAEYSGGIAGSGVGVGGSMARFGITGNTLYIVESSELHIYDISNVSSLTAVKTTGIGWGIETMFILEDYMFLGTQNGMLIYDISVPVSPMYISQFWHVTSCDPVVVQGTLAYVTLRGGSNCWSDINELNIISINNIEEPYLVKAYPMVSPYGLGIDGEVLFICDGDAGLKIYNVSDPLTVDENQIAHYPEIFGYDVIPLNGNLLLIGEDGFYQYNYDDVENIQLLSKIEISAY
ncbi:MAG: hypothetical protein GY834_14420 [Bacteroidetes bacterium]|nr:hypothetical protein [Bacteroidota bacterium]